LSQKKHNRVPTHARKHNRILLGLDTERDIKENQGEIEREIREQREQEFYTDTTSFLIWWFCGLT